LLAREVPRCADGLLGVPARFDLAPGQTGPRQGAHPASLSGSTKNFCWDSSETLRPRAMTVHHGSWLHDNRITDRCIADTIFVQAHFIQSIARAVLGNLYCRRYRPTPREPTGLTLLTLSFALSFVTVIARGRQRRPRFSTRSLVLSFLEGVLFTLPRGRLVAPVADLLS
jgi:hypothetical protein